MKTTNFQRALAAAVVLGLAGCASTPKGPPAEIVRLEGELSRLHADSRIATNAPEELHSADIAVASLRAESRNLSPEMFAHGVYLADRLVQTAEAEGRGRYADVHAKELGAERERLVAEARTHQLDIARADANAAHREADAERLAAAQARMDADSARDAAADARDELETMRVKFVDLQAEKTARGLVVTLGDVLFEIDRAELKPGASRRLDALVEALKTDPGTTVVIEGHTDSTGGHDHNIALSQARAEAVQSYLTSHGVDSTRIVSRGMGPDYPIASNDTMDGRQQNRRVEVVVQTNVGINSNKKR